MTLAEDKDMKELKVTRKVQPGKPGAKRELKRYRENLFAVRYRADGDGRYMKTAEIIIYDRQEE